MPDVYVKVRQGHYARSAEHEGFVLDYDSLGYVIGVEVRDALSVDIDSTDTVRVTVHGPDDEPDLRDSTRDSDGNPPTV